MASSITTNDPHTPDYTDLTPYLSSSSPDTPKKESYTPTILQTPTRMGYNGIGVGVRPSPVPSPSKTAIAPSSAVESVAQKEVEGLGYGIELDEGTIDVSAEMDRGEGSSSSSKTIVLGTDSVNLDKVDEGTTQDIQAGDRDIEFPTLDEMKVYQDRLSGSSEVENKDLVEMVKSLLEPCLNHLPVLRDQVEAQRATIQTLQHQAKLSKELTNLERDRHSAERRGWHREMKALVSSRDREIAAGKRPRKGLELNVGYHQELEASNKRLEMDNRLMAPRLADTQRQIDKLVNELRHLRSNVIMSTSAVDDDSHPGRSRQTQAGRRKSLSPTRALFNATTMGDARSEHLLLAARKVRSMRQENSTVGMLTLSELQRSGVVGPEGGLGYSEGYGHEVGQVESDDESDFEEGEEELEDRKPIIDHSRKGSKGKASVNNTPSFPKTKKGTKQNLPAPPITPRSRKPQGQGPPPTTTPGGSNFSDLLRAAELATRPQTPKGDGRVPLPMSAMSATRTRMREESSERGSPVKKARRVVVEAEVEGNQDGGDSALDLLAQASQLEVAQGSTPEAETEVDPLSIPTPTQQSTTAPASALGSVTAKPPSSSGSFLEPPIDLHPTPPIQPPVQDQGQDQDQDQSLPQTIKTPSSRPRNLSISQLSELQTPRGNFEPPHPHPGHATDPPAHHAHPHPHSHSQYQSPQGSVPGLGKYVHLSSSMPARRVRSPYLKWTVEEDELLARAVAIHGEKWDLVSKGVPTRSYHQVRQRWLRKTGAFDKKQLQSQPGDHHGSSNLGLGFGMPLPLPPGMGIGMRQEMMMDEDREGSPTPQSGRGKKRRGSADE